MTVLYRLAKRVEDSSREFAEFVKEQHAVVGLRYFPWCRYTRSATDECRY